MQVSGVHTLPIVNRYVEALVQCKPMQSPEVREKVMEEARSLVSVLQDDAPLALLLLQLHYQSRDPQALEKMLSNLSLSPVLSGLFRILGRNKRLLFVRMILQEFLRRLASLRGEILCKIRTSGPLSKERLAEIASTIEVKMKKKVVLEHQVDPGLLGGIVIDCDHQMLDLSAIAYLKTLKQSVLGSLAQRTM
jgi:F-type H+-transporting ATPase subunit delta